MRIENLTIREKPIILKIWKSQGNVFGIPFKSEVDDLIEKGQFYCMKEDNQIIAICAYKIMRKGIKICHLWTAKRYRGQHIAIKLMNHIVKQHEDEEVFVSCKDGADNNSFYERYKLEGPFITHGLNIDTREYKLDKHKIMEESK